MQFTRRSFQIHNMMFGIIVSISANMNMSSIATAYKVLFYYNCSLCVSEQQLGMKLLLRKESDLGYLRIKLVL